MPLTLNNDSWVAAVEPRDEEQASLPLSQHDGHRGGGGGEGPAARYSILCNQGFSKCSKTHEHTQPWHKILTHEQSLATEDTKKNSQVLNPSCLRGGCWLYARLH